MLINKSNFSTNRLDILVYYFLYIWLSQNDIHRRKKIEFWTWITLPLSHSIEIMLNDIVIIKRWIFR